MSKERKKPAQCNYVFQTNKSNIVDLTIISKYRKKVFSNHETHLTIINAWKDADEWLVGKYVIMPDHIHLFCAPTKYDAKPIATWIKFWKSMATRFWPNEEDKPLWQPAKWDRILRSGDNYTEKWHYYENNPVRAGLVNKTSDWPYRGELNSFRWTGG